MATVTTLSSSARGSSPRGRTPYLVQNSIDFGAAATAKGTALAASDIIEAITVPANTMILDAGFEVTTVHAGTSTDCALDLGVTGVDVDAYVDGFDFDGASAGAYSVGAGNGPLTVGATADTLDVLIQAQTGTTTAGVIRVFALLLDVDDIGTVGADEVDRDTLA